MGIPRTEHFEHREYHASAVDEMGHPIFRETLYHWLYQWVFQDPKMEVLYHIRPYFLGIFPYIGLI